MAVSNQQSRDAALLRATTEMFVLEPNHDRDEIHRFEELATHFLGKVGAADRAFVAERLSKSIDAPGSILRRLGKDLAEIASPILKRSPALGEFDLLAIMASTGPAHHRLIATRRDLTPTVVSALRRTGDPDVIDRLGGYPAVTAELPRAPEPPPAPIAEAPAQPIAARPIPARPVAEATPPAQGMPADTFEVFAATRAMTAALSRELGSLSIELPRTPAPESIRLPPLADWTPAAPASEPAFPAAAPATANGLPGSDAFLDMNRSQRLNVLAELRGGEPVRSRHSPMIDADQAFRVALGRARVASTARQKQRDALVKALSEGLRLDPAQVTALIDDPSGEPLVVLLKAIGLSEIEAQQVLLFANPLIAQAIESFIRLNALLAETEKAAAERLVQAWQVDRRAAAPQPTHQPLFADMELRRPARAATPAATHPMTSKAEAEPAERAVFGRRGA